MHFFKKTFLIVVLTLSVFLPRASAAILDVSDLTLVSTFEIDGHYNLAGVEFWNGLPLSPTNRPSDAITPMHADINLFVRNTNPNQLYVVVSDVLTTQGASWYGNAFVNITQTGTQFSLPLLAGGFLGGAPGLSGAFAITGQTLLSPPDVVTPLDTTPNYRVDTLLEEFLIRTIDDRGDYGLVGNNFAFIDSAFRIRNSGVFELTFDPTINLLDILDYGAMQLQARYGNGTQYIQGNQTYAYIQPPSGNQGNGQTPTVPEPSTWALMTLGLAGLGIAKRFKR